MPERSTTRRAVLFDLDGVLVLTDQLKAKAHAQTVKTLGGDVPESFYQFHMGESHEAVRKAFLTKAQLAVDPVEYTRQYHQIYRHLLETRLEVAPGATDLVRRLAARGFLLGVVTSSRTWMLEYILSRTGLKQFFDAWVCFEDVDRRKPAPDAYCLAIARLQVERNAVIAVEDSASGVEAARAAGIPVFAIRHQLNQGHDFTKAVAEFNSLRDSGPILEAIESILIPAPA